MACEDRQGDGTGLYVNTRRRALIREHPSKHWRSLTVCLALSVVSLLRVAAVTAGRVHQIGRSVYNYKMIVFLVRQTPPTTL